MYIYRIKKRQIPERICHGLKCVCVNNVRYTIPWAIMAFATFMNPATLAPLT